MKYLVLINPASGSKKGKKIFERILPQIRSKGVEVEYHFAKYKGHPRVLIQELEIQSFDAILVVGGDGTMHEVINGMLFRSDGKRLPIGLIPAGSGNSLMHDLNCLDPSSATRGYLDHKIKCIDLAKIYTLNETMYSFNVVGWGMPVSINLLAEKLRWIGGQRYNIASIFEIMRNPIWPVKFTIEDQTIQGNVSLFLACHTKYSGNGMYVAPKAKLDDGLIDVLIFKKGSRRHLFSLFTKIFSGKHIEDPLVGYYQVKKFSIQPKTNGPLIVDGQMAGTTPIEIEVLKKEIEILSPT